MTPEEQRVYESLKRDALWEDSALRAKAKEIVAMFNPPPEPKRDHNSLAVTENTPKGTLVRAWSGICQPQVRYFSHISHGKPHCFCDGKRHGAVVPFEKAERYIGQHFIPWDASQSAGEPPCDGRVITRYFDGTNDTTVYKDSPDWSQVTGYLPITETGEIDWERVPR